MKELDSFREELKQSILSWLELHIPGSVEWYFDIIILLWIIALGIALHYFLHIFIKNILNNIVKKEETWQQALLSSRLFSRVSFVIQGTVVHIQAGLWFDNSSSFLRQLLESVCEQWILLFGLLAFFSILNTAQHLIYRHARKSHFPVRGLIQTIKLIAWIIAGLLAISLMLDKSPVILLSGLGAISAILLLVFKDPILGLVAGIQLSANEMLSIGDWLEMPKYGADGDVIDIALTTVKVQNWDKTITTIPTYALISDSFKNWRGMSDSGGRRIKRSILIEISSICFIDDGLIQHLKKADLLNNYLTQKLIDVENTNRTRKTDMSVNMNGRRLTNIGTFRAYLLSFLETHPNIHPDMTLMVRQLPPTNNGLPIEIYAFTNTTEWVEYENIQSDIFDHIFAILPEFKLRAHEHPTGNDINFYTKKLSSER